VRCLTGVGASHRPSELERRSGAGDEDSRGAVTRHGAEEYLVASGRDSGF
jgi:hypothetical protein